jgi:hypothetical protein
MLASPPLGYSILVSASYPYRLDVGQPSYWYMVQNEGEFTLPSQGHTDMDNVAPHRAHMLIVFVYCPYASHLALYRRPAFCRPPSIIPEPARTLIRVLLQSRIYPIKQAPTLLPVDDPTTRAVINHNPLPELTHEDFVSLLGPILVPEHYNGLQSHHWHSHPSLPQFPPTHAVYGPGPGLPPPIPPLPEHQQLIQNQLPSPPLTSPPPPLPLNTPGLPNNPPFTCLHFTGRHKEADKITC